MGKEQHSGVVTTNNSKIKTEHLKPGVYHLNVGNQAVKFIMQ